MNLKKLRVRQDEPEQKSKVSRSSVGNKIKFNSYADSNIKENADFFMERGG